MVCKNCYAVDGPIHPISSEMDWTLCKCGLGYDTYCESPPMMVPVKKCEKVKSWKALERRKKEMQP